jgi:hypothetical protein
MKNPKKPTYTQRKVMEKWKLNPMDWLVERDTPNELVLVNRYSDSTMKRILKE